MQKKIVLIGGGHGLSNLVKGFKDENIDLSVIISSTDDGGHTGLIRDEFNSVAIGDLRMVLNELLDASSVLKDVFNYRFEYLHGTRNVSLGNLVITSLWNKYLDIDKVIDCFKERENIKINIFLSSNNPLTLCAECDGGEIINNERLIGISNKKIKRLFVDKNAICNVTMLDKIKNADIIVLAPGSLYTSVGAVLCIDKINESIKESKASIVYVANIMTQDGETKGFSLNDHVDVLEDILNKKIDRVIANNGKIEDSILEKYRKENSCVVSNDEKKDNYEFYNIVEIKDGKVRHNSEIAKKIILNQ